MELKRLRESEKSKNRVTDFQRIGENRRRTTWFGSREYRAISAPIILPCLGYYSTKITPSPSLRRLTLRRKKAVHFRQPPLKHGYYSKSAIEEREWLRELLKGVDDLLDEMVD